MSIRFQVRVYENRQLVESAEFDGPVEIGRQNNKDEGLFARGKIEGGNRWVIAKRDETMIGRRQMQMVPLPGDRVRVINKSERQPIRFLDGTDLGVEASVDLPLPVVIILSATKTLRVERTEGGGPVVSHSLVNMTMPPRSGGGGLPSMKSLVANNDGLLKAEDVVAWFKSVMDVLQAAANSPSFFDEAARALVATLQLDVARVSLLEADTWSHQSAQSAAGVDAAGARPPSRTFLDRMRKDKKVTWETPRSNRAEDSLSGTELVVAAPILNRASEVIGALYGERRHRARSSPPFGDLEAQVVEMLARGVAAGIARVQDEKAAIAAQVQMEQFFTADLARKLMADPSLLDGQVREVTIMFADIRSFSLISEALQDPKTTIEWCRHVLDKLTESVHNHGGVIVDYIGDGLMAMWGAPDDQPDHAIRACRAAQQILDVLPSLAEHWGERIRKALPQNIRDQLREVVSVGIGINSGKVQVGNVGASMKFKYGALGHPVNLASRVQGTTKYFKTKVVLTEPTRDKLVEAVKERPDEQFITRRLGLVKLVGLNEIVDLYELFGREHKDAGTARDLYEQALALFQEGRFSEAARMLGNWRHTAPNDDAVLPLLYHAVEAMVKGKSAAHPVLVMGEK